MTFIKVLRKKKKKKKMAAKVFSNTLEWVVQHKIRFFLMAGVFVALLLLFLDWLFLDLSNGVDILVEAHGMLLDIILFGVILKIYETFHEREYKRREIERERLNDIKRYQEELDDYQGWHEKEATYRILGAIRRLNRLGVTQINLNSAYLPNVNLHGTNLQSASLVSVNLQGARATDVNFEGAKMGGGKFQSASLQGAKMNNCNLSYCNFHNAQFYDAKLINSDLSYSDFRYADLRGAVLIKSNLMKANFENADLTYADLSGVKLFMNEKECIENYLRNAYAENYYQPEEYPLPENWKETMPSHRTLRFEVLGLNKAIIENTYAFESQKKYFAELFEDEVLLKKMKWEKDPTSEEERNQYPWIEWDE